LHPWARAFSEESILKEIDIGFIWGFWFGLFLPIGLEENL
jgi:hypothetical protein